MVQDSEKRFQSVMDKLFHAPKSRPNPPSSSVAQSSRGKKRPNPASALAVVESGGNTSQAPLCRPWDRGDLMRRVATFKSMTWFAKPKVVSAINCARRGWINVEMDTIACESCGARMLLSTPSSWSQEQVDKVALVFSLKLDSGHKMLCPWMDNLCDETLAQFPPTPTLVLVDGYKQRSSALLQLLALPVVSSSAIDYMRSPQLEQLLARPSALGCGNGSTDAFTTEYLGNEHEADFAYLYYQAQKLISLCGWECRLLPYVVDCKDQCNQSAKESNVLELSHLLHGGEDRNISVYSSDSNRMIDTNQSDHSVVLDCKLCGASVGLWAFSMLPRPVELLRLVGFSEVNGENNSTKENAISSLPGTYGTHQLGNDNLVGTGEVTVSNTANLSRESLSNLSLTIAGGPPPTKQNFRATISLPIVGHNLRARLFPDSKCGDRKLSDMTCGSQEAIRSEPHNDNQFMGNDDTESSLSGQLPSENHNMSEKGDVLCNQNNETQTSEGKNVNDPETASGDMEIPGRSTDNLVQAMDQNDKLPEPEEIAGSFDQTVMDSQVKDSSLTTPDSKVNNVEVHMNTPSVMAVIDSCKVVPETDTARRTSSIGHQESSCTGSKGENSSEAEDSSGAQLMGQNGGGIEHSVQTSASNEVASSVAKDVKQIRNKAMEFDPIKQHRHFCPWIATTGSTAPGWKQTLAALQQHEFSDSSPTKSPSSDSIIKVDDPISSIRNLFMSPSSKRKKLTHGSS